MREKRALKSHPLANSTLRESLFPAVTEEPVTSSATAAAPVAVHPGSAAEPQPTEDVPQEGPTVSSTPPRRYRKKTLYNLKAAIKGSLRRPSLYESAEILEGLVKAKTPEFKVAIRDRGLKSAARVTKARRNFFCNCAGVIKRTKTPARKMSKSLLRRVHSQKQNKWNDIIKEFYLRFDMSRVLPHARHSTKHGPAHVMTTTIRAAWMQFVLENPGVVVGYTKFAGLCPRNVRLLGSVKYKLDAINRQLLTRGLEMLLPENKLLKWLRCEASASGYPKPACIFAECPDCTDSLSNVSSCCKDILMETVSWLKWELGEDQKLTFLSRSGTVIDLLKSFKEDIDRMTKTATFREHIFTAHWQHTEVKSLKLTLEEGEAMMIMDFDENRKACFGSKVKSAHFSKRQISLHPIVVYWKDRHCQLVRHVLMYLSDDIRHDHHAVHHFTMHAIEHVKKYVHLRRVILFSDGCPSQYKGKGSFGDLSLIKRMEGERAYYGSEHGKGEANGETGALGNFCDPFCETRLVLTPSLNKNFNQIKQTKSKHINIYT